MDLRNNNMEKFNLIPESQTIENQMISYACIVWQICPKCNGQGVLWNPTGQPMNDTYLSDGKSFECDVCNGKKIINIQTGKPPD